MSVVFRAHFALALVALIYGANYSIAKVVLDGGFLTPPAFILLRVVSGLLLFSAFHRYFVGERIERTDWGRLVLCGLFGVAVNQMFFFMGLKLTNPINASLIMTTTPILVLVASSLLIGERITSKKLLGIASKRLPLDSGYFETFNRDNVSLVDLRETPIERIVAAGVKTSEKVHELDVLVFATGFDALTGPLIRTGIRGRGGCKLEEKWAEGPRTYLGVASEGFPNMFMVTGPGSPSVLGNMPTSIEQHVDWICECIAHLREQGAARIEPQPEAEAEWNDHVQELANETLFPQANSWYLGANIPGKPRVFLPYIGGFGTYRKLCNEVAEKGYEGFVIS